MRAAERTPWQHCRNVGGDAIPGLSCAQIVDASTEEIDGRRIEVLHVRMPNADISGNNLVISDNQVIPAEDQGDLSVGRCTRGGLAVVRTTRRVTLRTDDVFGSIANDFVAHVDGVGLTFHGWVDEERSLAYVSFRSDAPKAPFGRIRGILAGDIIETTSFFNIESIRIIHGEDPRDDPGSETETVRVYNDHQWKADQGALCRAEYEHDVGLWSAYQVDCPEDPD